MRDGTWVTDMPGALRADTVARLNQTIADTENTHGIEIAVVIVQSLDGVPAANVLLRWCAADVNTGLLE